MADFATAAFVIDLASTFAGMAANYKSYKLAEYNTEVNDLNTMAGLNNDIRQRKFDIDTATSNIGAIKGQRAAFINQQNDYMTDIRDQGTTLESDQTARIAASGMAGAGTQKALRNDIVNQVKKYTDIVMKRITLTDEYDENGNKIYNSELDMIDKQIEDQYKQIDAFNATITADEDLKRDLKDLKGDRGGSFLPGMDSFKKFGDWANDGIKKGWDWLWGKK